ncbi:hypothetical protein ES703_90330 [subsurface metagenome]
MIYKLGGKILVKDGKLCSTCCEKRIRATFSGIVECTEPDVAWPNAMPTMPVTLLYTGQEYDRGNYEATIDNFWFKIRWNPVGTPPEHCGVIVIHFNNEGVWGEVFHSSGGEPPEFTHNQIYCYDSCGVNHWAEHSGNCYGYPCACGCDGQLDSVEAV